MLEPLWRLRDVRLGAKARSRIDVPSLAIGAGVTAVLGPSGAGKTSLLNLLVNFEEADAGSVTAPSVETDSGDRLPCYWVPQQGGLWPELTAREHLLAVQPGAPWGDADAWLAALDLTSLAERRPSTLSQGEAARLSVARCLASEADALVMDEPLAHVDPTRVGHCWTVIREEVARRNATLVFATHRPRTALAEAEEVICLRDGTVRWQGAVATLYDDAPTEELAGFLGEVNWLEPEDARWWLPGVEGVPRCLRPERLSIDADEAGCATVTETHFQGDIEEVTMRDENEAERVFHHRPPVGRLRSGMRVALRLLGLLLLAALLASGCGEDEEDQPPSLAVTAVAHWRMPTEGTRLPGPRSAAIAPDGEVFVLDNAGRVIVFGPDGKVRRQWSMPATENGRPEGVCVLKDGRLAVCDTHYNQVVFFDRQIGKVLGTFGSAGKAEGEFIYPVAITQDDAGQLYIAEYGGNDRVQVFTPQGEFVRTFGHFGTGPGELQRPSGLAWVDGNVYVADAVNNRVLIFDTVGAFVGRLGGDGENSLSLYFPYDISPGIDNTLYIAEYGNGRVTRTDMTGRVLGRWGSTGSGPKNLSTPWGLATDSRGLVTICDTGNRRVVCLTVATAAEELAP